LQAPEPNPVESTLRVRYALERAAHVRLGLFDALGRRVAHVDEGPRPAGSYELLVDVGAFPPGAYVIRLEADGGSAARIVVRR
jgi:hypothetical protein